MNNFSSLSAELTDELTDLLKDASFTDKMRQEVEELTRLLHDNLEKVVQHGKRADHRQEHAAALPRGLRRVPRCRY